MLKLVTGRAKSGKTGHIIKKMMENAKNSRKSFFMVPEQMTLETEQMMTKIIKEPLFYIKIMSFDRLSMEVLSKSGGVKKRYIDDIGKIMLIERIMKDIKDQLNVYKNTVNKAGFIETVEKTISEFENQDISSDMLFKISENIKDKQMLSLKIKDIALIYKSLENSLKGRYVDNQSRLKLLCEKLPQYSKNENYEVFFDNYIEFSNIEKQVIYTLLQNEVDVTVCLALEDEKMDSSFFIAKNTFNELKLMAEEIGTKCEIKAMEEVYFKDREIEHLEKYLGSFSYMKYMGTNKSIKSYRFDESETEIEFTANMINHLIRKKDYRYNQIAVVVTDLEGYRKIIKKVFSKYSIPYFVDEKRTVTKENIIRLIFSFLDMFCKSPNYKNVMAFFKTGMSDIKKEEYEVFENYLIRWNMDKKSYMDEKYFTQERYFSDISQTEEEKIKTTYGYIKEIYEKYKKVFSKKSVSRKYSETINEFLQQIRAKEKINGLIERLKSTKNYEICAEISQIWNIFMQTLEKINSVLEDMPVDITEYKNMLYNGLNAQDIAIIPSTVDRVLIMDIKRSKSLGCRMMFISGLNDTLLPIQQKIDVIFQEQDKNTMNEYDLEIRNTAKKDFLRENSLIYSIITRAEEGIILTSPAIDINHQSAGRSSYLIKIQNIFPNMKEEYINIENMRTDEKYRENMTLNVLFSTVIENLASQIEKNELKEEEVKLFKYFEQNPYFEEKCKKVKKALFLENDIENIDVEDVRKIYSLPLNISASQIQTYITCPFKHYMNYAIRPQKRETVMIDNIQGGNIMHRYMEEFSKEILEDDRIRELDTKDKIEKFVESIYKKDEFLDKNTKNAVENSKRQDHIIYRLKNISNKITEFLIAQKSVSSFKTENSEYEIKPLEIILNENEEDDLNRAIINGKVDRIDSIQIEGEKYIQIIDYKSSDKKIKVQDIINAVDIQLLLYAYAVTKEKNARIHAVFYMPMDDPIISGEKTDLNKIDEKRMENFKMNSIMTDDINLLKALENNIEKKSAFFDVRITKDEVKGTNVLCEEDMKLLINHILQVIKEASSEILKGNIKPNPVKQACEYCEYKNICGFDPTIKGYEYRMLKSREKAIEALEKNKEGKKDELD